MKWSINALQLIIRMSELSGKLDLETIDDGVSLCQNLGGVLAVLKESGIVADEITVDDVIFDKDGIRDKVFSELENPEVIDRIMGITQASEEQVRKVLSIALESSQRTKERRHLLWDLIVKEDYEAIDGLFSGSSKTAQKVLVREFLYLFLKGTADDTKSIIRRIQDNLYRISNDMRNVIYNHLFGQKRESIIEEAEVAGAGDLVKTIQSIPTFAAVGALDGQASLSTALTENIYTCFTGENGEKVIELFDSIPELDKRVSTFDSLWGDFMGVKLPETHPVKQVMLNRIINDILEEVKEIPDVPGQLNRIKELTTLSTVTDPLCIRLFGENGESITQYLDEEYGPACNILAARDAYGEFPEHSRIAAIKKALEEFLKKAIGEEGEGLTKSIEACEGNKAKIEAILVFCDLAHDHNRGEFNRSYFNKYPQAYMAHMDPLMHGLISDDDSAALKEVLGSIEGEEEKYEYLCDIDRRMVVPRSNCKTEKALRPHQNTAYYNISGEDCSRIQAAVDEQAGLVEKAEVIQKFSPPTDGQVSRFIEIIRDCLGVNNNVASALIDDIVTDRGYEEFNRTKQLATYALSTLYETLNKYTKSKELAKTVKEILKRAKAVEYQIPKRVEL